jgi:tripartite-type tricarboxylate transporter receptor subunit TctC
MLAAALIAPTWCLGAGQDYPNRPVRIVTAQVGGGADFTARLVAQGITAPLGQQVIVENHPAGVIPGEIVSHAQPDGHTLLIAGNSLYLTPLIQASVPYDAIKDFAPITAIAISPTFLVVNTALPVKTVKDLIELAKEKPGALNYSEGGTGGTPHLAAELFKSMAGVNVTRVTYSGGGPALTAVIGGEVQVTFASGGSIASLIKSGKLRSLGVTSAKPSIMFPDLPPVAMTVPGYEAVQIIGIWAPSKVPMPIIYRLNQEIVRLISTAEMKKRFLDSGQEIVANTPEQFTAQIKADLTAMGKVIRDAGIRSD